MYVTIRQHIIERLDTSTPIVRGPFATKAEAWQDEADRLGLEGEDPEALVSDYHEDSFEVTRIYTPEKVAPEHGDDWADIDDKLTPLVRRAKVAATGTLEKGIYSTKPLEVEYVDALKIEHVIEDAATNLSRSRLKERMKKLAWEHDLMEAYPKLYGNLRGNQFECGPGWIGLLDEAGAKLEGMLPEDFDKTIIVKEKFGTLRIQGVPLPEEGHEVIHDITNRSATICEACGSTDEVRRPEWSDPRCKECRDE